MSSYANEPRPELRPRMSTPFVIEAPHPTLNPAVGLAPNEVAPGAPTRGVAPVKSGLVKNVVQDIGLNSATSAAPPPTGGPVLPRGPGGPSGVVPIGPDGKPVVSTTPGDKGTYGGTPYTVDANGVARIDTASDGNEYGRRASYQEEMFKFAQAHPELVGQTVNIYEHPYFRDAAGNYTGPIDHPDYSNLDPKGFTGKDPKTGYYLLRGQQASFGNNESDFKNFFTRQIVAPPSGWKPGQVVTSSYDGNRAVAATPRGTTPAGSGLGRGDPTVGLQENNLHPTGASGLTRPAGVPNIQRPATPAAPRPYGSTPVTRDVKPPGAYSPLPGVRGADPLGTKPAGTGDTDVRPGAFTTTPPPSSGLGRGDSIFTASRAVGLETEPRTATFADGGRVGRRRRRPVTIEQGYADIDGDEGETGYADGGRAAMTDFERRYFDGLRARALEIAKGTANVQAEGSGWTSQDEAAFNRQWDGLSLAQALQMSRDQNWGANRFGESDVDQNDPLVQQFISQFGAERQYTDAQGRPMNRPDSNNTVARGWVMGYGDPTYAGQSGDDEILQDGSRILRLPDGRYIREAGNLNGETIAATHRGDETGFRNIRRNAAIGAAAVVGGGLAFNALGGGGLGGGVNNVGLGASEVGTAAAAGAPEVSAAVTAETLAANPAVQQAARGAGQTVGQWLSNPRNFLQAARLVGGLVSSFSGGRPGGGNVPLVPPPGTTPPPGATPPPGSTPPPGGPAPPAAQPPAAWQPRTGAPAPDTDVDLSYLDSLNPDDYGRGPADLARWNEARGRSRPIEDLLFSEAMKAGSAEEQEAAAARAGADVTQKFHAAEQDQRRRLIAQGVNPDDGRGPGAELDRLSTLDEAKATAGGKNIARISEKNRGLDARVKVGTLGSQIAGQALTADQIGLNHDQANDRLRADIAGRRADLTGRTLEGNATRRTNTWDRTEDRASREYDSAAGRDMNRYGIETGRDTNRYQIDTNRDSNRYSTDQNNLTARERIAMERDTGNYNRNRQDRIDTGRGIDTAINWGERLWNSYRGSGPGSNWAAAGGSTPDWGPDGWGGMKDGGRLGYKHGGRPGEDIGLERQDLTDGARVEGPGTPTSDSIPAKLSGKKVRVSNKEGVLNGPAMEYLDATEPGKFEELNEIGRKIRAVRKALTAGLADVGLGD